MKVSTFFHSFFLILSKNKKETVFATLFLCMFCTKQGFAAPPVADGYNPERSAQIAEPNGPSILDGADGEIELSTHFKVIDYYSFEVALQSMQGNSSPADLQFAKDFALPARSDETVGLIAHKSGDLEFYSESGSGQGIIVALDPTWTEDGRIIFTKYFTYFGTIEGEAVWAGVLRSRLIGTFLGGAAECLHPERKPQCIQIAPMEQGRDCAIYNSLDSPLTHCDQSLSNIAAQNDTNGLALLFTDNTLNRLAGEQVII